MNSTLATLRSRLRTLLNDPNKKMWSDAVLNDFLAQTYKYYYAKHNLKNSQYGIEAVSVTYPASSALYNLSGASAPYIVSIVEIVDVTDSSNPFVLIRANARELNRVVESYPTGGKPSHWMFVTTESTAAGVLTVNQQLALAPIPTSARTLSMTVQRGPEATQLSADTHTTGMSGTVETCMIFKAMILARIVEENPNVSALQAELTKAEKDMVVEATEIYGPHDAVTFDPRWIE